MFPFSHILAAAEQPTSRQTKFKRFYQNFQVLVHFFSSGSGFSKKVFFNQSNGCEVFRKEIKLMYNLNSFKTNNIRYVGKTGN
jgi:hypothetical protein